MYVLNDTPGIAHGRKKSFESTIAAEPKLGGHQVRNCARQINKVKTFRDIVLLLGVESIFKYSYAYNDYYPLKFFFFSPGYRECPSKRASVPSK